MVVGSQFFKLLEKKKSISGPDDQCPFFCFIKGETVMTIVQKAMEKGLIFDGAMGTMLISAGLEGGKAAETWILEKPEEITKVHQGYFDAGADIITTATFGGNPVKLKKAGLEKKADEINEKAARLAKQVAGQERYVAGNIGPAGELLQPSGPLSVEAATDSFAGQADVLAKNGVDLFLVHTFFDINESIAAIKGIQSVSDLPIFAAMTFQEKNNGFATIMGNRVEPSMKALVDAGASVVGANCSIGSDRMIFLAEEIRQAVSTLVMAKPNAGSPQISDGKTFYTENAETFSENMRRIKSLGVEVIGGCCGSTPEFIRRIVQEVRRNG